MTETQIRFKDRGERLAAFRASLSDDDRQLVAELQQRGEQETRAYQMQLAAVRRAGQLTQAELARRLGKPQGNVSRTESSSDMLLSTLRAYLEAAGATDVAITATMGGNRIEVLLT
jgi:DNA-binding transcriptional regulator YiaG